MLKSIVLAGVCSVGFLTPAFAQAGKPHFITRQTTNEWRASKLVGVSVYGTNNKKIGSIEEIMVTPKGRARVAVIGVGGFLGMGQKNVGVPFSSLQWKREQEGRTATTSNKPNTANPAVAAAKRGYPDHAVLAATQSELKNAPSFKFAQNQRSLNGSGSNAAAPATSAPATGAPANGATVAPANGGTTGAPAATH